MKFSCLQENLIKGLLVIGYGIGKEVNLPILSNILLKTEEGMIVISSTNLEIGITCRIRGKIEKQGKNIIPGRIFIDFIQLLPKEKITIESDEQNNICITCKNFSTRIKTIQSEDFPIIPSIEKQNGFHASLQEFKTTLQKVIFSVSGVEGRPELNGILFSYKKGEQNCIFVGTNTVRLSESFLPLKEKQEKDALYIFPLKTIQEILRSIQLESEGDIQWFINENQVVFLYENIEIISKYIQGIYPDYQQIIPPRFSTKAIFPLKELISAVKATSIFSRKNLYDIQFRFYFLKDGSGECEISAQNMTFGENKVILSIDLQGSENNLVFNYRYLLDGLNVISDSRVCIQCVDGNTPCIINPFSQKNFQYLLMPIKE